MKLKDLLAIAVEELKTLTSLDKPDFRLEQAVFKDDAKIWEVVVSFLVENTNRPTRSPIYAGAEYEFLRLYKSLQINEKGEVIAMFIFNSKE